MVSSIGFALCRSGCGRRSRRADRENVSGSGRLFPRRRRPVSAWPPGLAVRGPQRVPVFLCDDGDNSARPATRYRKLSTIRCPVSTCGGDLSAPSAGSGPRRNGRSIHPGGPETGLGFSPRSARERHDFVPRGVGVCGPPDGKGVEPMQPGREASDHLPADIRLSRKMCPFLLHRIATCAPPAAAKGRSPFCKNLLTVEWQCVQKRRDPLIVAPTRLLRPDCGDARDSRRRSKRRPTALAMSPSRTLLV